MIVAEWFLYFIVYAAIGYVLESIFCAIEAQDHKLRGRGFLFGPICPIYGCGALLVVLCHQLWPVPLWATFFVTIILCDTLEYLTSFLMEKLFKVRWWDYRESMKYTINGRVSLYTSILFGIGGVVIVYFAHPIIEFLIGLLPGVAQVILAIVLLIIMIIDINLSVLAALAIKGEVLKGVKIGLTPEIKKFARDYYRRHNRLKRKLQRKLRRRHKHGQSKRG
ncbi:putative ABC transporter permease [Candidatus Saccharibacteria bacterium]|nr:putative ABC transporter permease [Candidatus Saccharibacteria bacterium]